MTNEKCFSYSQGRCHFCQEDSKYYCVHTKDCIIKVCGSCNAVWRVTDYNNMRMQVRYSTPQTEEEGLLCPSCWSELKPDYDKWVLKCPEVTCGYQKRMVGESKRKRVIIKDYADFKRQLFSRLQETGDAMTDEEQNKLVSFRNAIKETD